MAELTAFFYLAYLIALGHFVQQILLGARPWRWTSLAWSFGVGSIVWSYTQFLLNVFNVSMGGMWFYGVQIVLLAIPFALQREGLFPPSPSFRVERKRDFVHLLPVCILAVAVLTAFLQAITLPMSMWDSIVMYGFKAKILFEAHTFKTEAFLNPAVLHNNADYPLLLPYLEAGFYRWLGHPDDRVVRILFLGYWVSWLALIYEALGDRIHRTYALWLTAFFASLPLFSAMYMGQAVSGFADIPFAFYWTAFYLCRKDRRLPIFALGCLFLKNEGWPAVLLGYLGLLLIEDGEYRRELMLAIAATSVFILPWVWVRHALPHNSAHMFRVLDTTSIHLLGQKLLAISLFFVEGQMGEFKIWGMFWILIYLGICCPPKYAAWPKESILLLVAVATQAMVYLYVYLIYPDSLTLLLPITLSRLLLHGAGLLVIAVGWRLERKTA